MCLALAWAACEDLPSVIPGKPVSQARLDKVSAFKESIGIGHLSEAEFRSHTRMAMERNPALRFQLSDRELIDLDLRYHEAMMRKQSISCLMADAAKSFERQMFADNGMIPPLTTGSKPYSFEEGKVLDGKVLLSMTLGPILPILSNFCHAASEFPRVALKSPV